MFKSVSIRGNIITGVLVLAPFGAVLGIVLWLWNNLLALTSLIPESLSPRALFGIENALGIHFLDFLTTIIILFLILFAVWLVGLISRNYFGKRILDSFSRFVARVPVLRTVYSTLEQLLATFASGQAKNFRRVVQIEYPRKGLYTLAFVTGERGGFLNIYVPTTPNPTSGFYLTVEASEVKEVKLSVEEALKEIISLGIVQKDGK